MNNNEFLDTIPGSVKIKNGLRHLLLFAIVLTVHSYCSAQTFKPKWVNDLRGASPYCEVTDLAVDKQNNVYVTGWFEGTFDFDPSAAVKNLTSVGQYDVFVAKYKQDGAFVWAESIGGGGTDQPNSIAVDKDGNVSFTGIFSSTSLDADPGSGVYTLTNASAVSGFLIHLDTNGNFLWAQSGAEFFSRVASDSQDNVVATSYYDAPVTIGDSIYTSPPVGFGGLVVKYSPTGTVLWNASLQVPGSATGNGVLVNGCKVDNQDNIIISGDFSSMVNFNPLGAAYDLTPSNKDASFVAKYSTFGTLGWVNGISLVSDVIDGSTSVGVDQQNNIYFSTPFYGLITFGTTSLTANGIDDNICITKYSPAGVLQFAKSIGGTDYIGYGSKFAFDKNNNFYLSGYFKGTVNFSTNSANAKNVSAHGPLDFYVAEYDQNGNYTYAFSGGSSSCGNTFGNGIAIDTSNNVDIGGAFCSTVNFDPSGCSVESLSAAASGSDGFIAQFASTAIANDVITAPAVTSFCTSGSPAAITGSIPTGGAGAYTYQWQSSTDSLNFINIQKADSINYTPPLLSATSFYRRVVSVNCATSLTSNVVTLHVSSAPAAPQAAGDTVCAGATATLSIISPQPGFTYNWFAAATGDTSLFTGASFTTSILSAANTYYAEADNGGCISPTRTAVTVTILPPLAVPVVTVGPITGTSMTFEWAAIPGATGYQVSTDSGKTFTSPSSGANGLTTIISGLQPGSSVSLIVEAIGTVACQLSTGSAIVTASIPKGDLIYVPNAFTPNGDGKNDLVHVHSESIQSMTFYIYDQWGELIFTSTNLQNGWDGTYKGIKEPAGAYIYYVQATMIDGQKVIKKGTITLIR